MEMRMHAHPNNPANRIEGRLLTEQDVLERGDLFDRPDGAWYPIQERLVGTQLSRIQLRIMTFIRPAVTVTL